jgi:penicillin G amidase
VKIVRRIVVVVLVVLLVLLVVGAAAGVLTVRRSFPQTDGRMSLDGLEDRVDVYRDEWGIPQIYASTSADLFFAQGYVHAQDRFWEMDFRRHVTAGRLSELFGADQVDTDRFIRTLGWRRVGQREIALLRPETVAYLEAYSDGVNAYLEERSGAALSLEYAVLGLQTSGYEPEPWTPADSVAWLKAMAWDLRANIEEELDRALLADEIGRGRVAELYPPYPFARNEPIVASDELEAVAAGAMDAHAMSLGGLQPALEAVEDALASAPITLGSPGAGLGSNSWVVSGDLTASGRPLLANDPHLAPAMPSIWYQMGLHCTEVTEACPFDVAGFTFSGFPGVIIGHNDRVAWGFTNMGADVADLYVERLSGDSYEYDGERVPLTTRTETIEVSGDDPVEIEVRSTRHGPLISDASDDFEDAAGRGHGIALRWTALEPGTTADAVFFLNGAAAIDDIKDAARAFTVPAQNIVFATVDGTIGYQAPGRIPVRVGYDGRWPVRGWTSRFEWDGYIPFRSLPSVVDPERGFVVTANNAVVDGDYAFTLTHDWSYGYRSDRIVKLLDGATGLTVEDMLAMQRDSRDGGAAALLPYFLDVADGRARSLLGGWDGSNSAGSAGAAYFNATWRNLLRLTFSDELPEDRRAEGGDRWFEVVRRLLREPDSEWWDDVDTDEVEGRDDILAAALDAGWAQLRDDLGDDQAEWRWGELHTLEVRNQSFGVSGIGPVEWLFNRGPLELAGSEDAVLATGWDASSGYEVNWIPSMRMVVDLADLDASRWVNLTGASGHAFHGHYFDQAELWAQGRTTPMRWSRARIEERAEDHLTLVPAG